MLAADVLKHLQSQFPGQLVLYAPDLAQVLGKSEKALSHLISRGQLPFRVKSLGGKNCVDIFQVADWLATDDGIADEVTDARATAGARNRSGSRGKRPSSEARSGIGAKLMEMRLGAARVLTQSVAMSGVAGQEFVVLLAEHLALLHDVPVTSFAVHAVWWEVIGETMLHNETRSRCNHVEEAHLCLQMVQRQLLAAKVATVTLRRGRNKLYHAFLRDSGDWLVVLDLLSWRPSAVC